MSEWCVNTTGSWRDDGGWNVHNCILPDCHEGDHKCHCGLEWKDYK